MWARAVSRAAAALGRTVHDRASGGLGGLARARNHRGALSASDYERARGGGWGHAREDAGFSYNTVLILSSAGALAAVWHFTDRARAHAESSKRGNSHHVEPALRPVSVIGGGAQEAPVFRIVLTGGPCAGKTTALASVSERLEELGFRVFLVPEAATLLLTGGAKLGNLTPDQIIRFQGALLRVQMGLEDAFFDLAKSTGQPSIIIADRGVMDGSAYMATSMWNALLDENGWNVVSLRDRRYEAVIHLVTSAFGAEQFYTLSNNAARSEDLELARQVDLRLREAWLGHPHLRIIDNGTDFPGKMRRVVDTIKTLVGLPIPVEVQRKFLIKPISVQDLGKLPVSRVEIFDVEEVFLRTSDGTEAKVRRRGQNGTFTYMHSVRYPMANGQRIELKRQISGRDYVNLLATADPNMRPVHKRRACFVFDTQSFVLDTFVEPHEGMTVLRVEAEHREQVITLPPGVAVLDEVTGNSIFSSAHLAANPVNAHDDVDSYLDEHVKPLLSAGMAPHFSSGRVFPAGVK
eukprot:tig00000792_g4175.t1